MSVPLLELIETRLSGHRPKRPLLRPLMRRSAVALILKVLDGELHILMIKRAERKGDRWSGHMAFPGGRLDPADAHGYAAALRETEEEIGLVLGSDDRCLGRLSDQKALPRRGRGMAISPFVFLLEREVDFAPNEEVAEVLWVPLEFLLDDANREEMVWRRGLLRYRLPCYNYRGRCIWGLSLRMLDELLELVTAAGRGRRRLF